VPWLPELFSAPVLERLEEKWELERIEAIPYYAGLMAGEQDALIRSFAGEPVLLDPLHGRIKGVRAFEWYVGELREYLSQLNMSFDQVEDVITEGRAFEEVVLHLDGQDGRVEIPVAIMADRQPDGRLLELRTYHSMWPVVGRHVHRPPLMQHDPELQPSDVVGEYQRALAAGDVDAIVETFEPDAYAREPTGPPYVHAGPEGLRAFFERMFSNGGGIPLEHCSLVDTGRACAIEYNIVSWGRTELPPEAGVAVYMRGDGGKLAAARIYDDVDPPIR
jgi:ketosteroid isomerase-like protein